jgi:protein-L-isoaspartate O-methyltransferase
MKGRCLVSFSQARHSMVERHLAARGIADPRVLAAFREVPREDLLPAGLIEFAYEDSPLPIEGGQTISQPRAVEPLKIRVSTDTDLPETYPFGI